MTDRAKRVFSLPQAKVEEVIRKEVITSPASIANILGVHVSTVQRKLDGLLHQGRIMVDEYDADGHPLNKPYWRYAINEED